MKVFESITPLKWRRTCFVEKKYASDEERMFEDLKAKQLRRKLCRSLCLARVQAIIARGSTWKVWRSRSSNWWTSAAPRLFQYPPRRSMWNASSITWTKCWDDLLTKNRISKILFQPYDKQRELSYLLKTGAGARCHTSTIAVDVESSVPLSGSAW